MSGKKKIFHFKSHKNAVILLGAYRSDKKQLEWILGEEPYRFERLYNVRWNDDLFAIRNGGILSTSLPDYILLYDYKNPSVGYHLFSCVSSSRKSEDEMNKLHYPNPKGNYMVYLLGDEVQIEALNINSLLEATQLEFPQEVPFSPIMLSGAFFSPHVDKSAESPTMAKQKPQKVLRIIDLFAGIGGIRCGLEQAAHAMGIDTVCVFTSEIKSAAIKVLHDNHPTETIYGDITKIDTRNIPDFDILCAGFPCQAFSSAGKRQGFADTRGTLFFEVERILREKRPQGFILENVEGLVNHDGGKTLQVIAERLTALNYHFDYKVLNSKHFGVPQERKRIYIVGSVNKKPTLDKFQHSEALLQDVLEKGQPTLNTPFIQNLLNHYSIEELYGKSIKDKRGGNTNIHSWDLEIKGPVSREQKHFLDTLLKERRKKKWAKIIGIEWMDGMPLTFEQIKSFYDIPNLQEWLDDLTKKGYLKYEYPKKLIEEIDENGIKTTRREYDTTKPKGYNIVTGKLSFEINKVMSPNDITPTLVAMDMQKLYVADNGGLRRLTLREGLRLFGYPETMIFNVSEKDGFDLLGNTVVVPVIQAVAYKLLKTIKM